MREATIKLDGDCLRLNKGKIESFDLVTEIWKPYTHKLPADLEKFVARRNKAWKLLISKPVVLHRCLERKDRPIVMRPHLHCFCGYNRHTDSHLIGGGSTMEDWRAM